MREKIPVALQDEITRAFDVAKKTVSLLYSRMELVDIPSAGMAYLLADLIEQEKAAVKWMAGE
jgi:hypothetical protein